jgi:exopolysaccharide biosynthesis polyprenyl glycosylphosphotransferase
MVTIDLRDRSYEGGERDSWIHRLRARATRGDAASVVWRRVIASDALAAAAALAALTLLLGFTPSIASVYVLAGWPIALVRVGAYNRRRLLTDPVELRALVTAAAWAFLAASVVELFAPMVSVRESLKLTILLTIGTAIGRWIVVRSVARARRHGELLVPVMARGTALDVCTFLAGLRRDPAPSIRVAAVQLSDAARHGEDIPWAHGFLDSDEFAGLTIVPRSVDVTDAAVRNEVASVVMLGPPELASDSLRRVIWACENVGIDTLILPIVDPVAPPRVHTLGTTGVPSLTFEGPNRQLLSVKIALDVVLASIGLIALAPLMAVIAVAIKATSSGPVLFRQTRVGRGGHPFTMLKFRTMGVDAELQRAHLEAQNRHASRTLFKIPDDPRVTKVGRVLRKHSLDELPQLINVVRREMSLVGPRPPLPDEVAEYPVDSMRRFVALPGLTGLWQVSGRSNLDPVQSALLDTVYVENWSLGLDLRILVRTARVILRGDGAY